MSEASNGHGKFQVERDPKAAEAIRRYRDDFIWFHQQFDLCEKYAGQVVIVHDRQVVGKGAREDEASVEARRYFAERSQPCPPPEHLSILIAPEVIWCDPHPPYGPETASAPAPPSAGEGEL